MNIVFLERKKDRENRPVINLKHLNQFIPYQHFKIEGLFYRREMLRKDENVQTGHEECLLFSTTSSNLNKICQIFMVRKPLRVSLTMFWLRPSTSNLQETFKSFHISTEANKHSCDNIPRQYAFDGTNNEGNFDVQRHNHLPSTTFGFHCEHGQINFTILLPQQKIKRIQRIKPKLKKLIGLLASTIQAVLPEQLNFLYLH